jgi:hypothetical protein
MLLGVLLITNTGISQEKKSYQMVEITYMMPKVGMEKAFVKAVKEHNQKFHNQDPYSASLDRIATGKYSGWFVWVMGPTTFSQLDNRPSKGAHEDHWNKTISPLVKKYGRTEYWRNNKKLSFKANDNRPPLENIWFVEVKRGEYYRFKDLISKFTEAFKKKGDDNFFMYNNQFNQDDGRDVAFVWTLNSWADMDDDDGGVKKYYEELNGEGSWENAMKEWQAVTESIKSEVWEISVDK